MFSMTSFVSIIMWIRVHYYDVIVLNTLDRHRTYMYMYVIILASLEIQ